MLIEMWERLRGYDKWIETQATIESSQVTETPVADRSGNVIDFRYAAGDVICWTDPTGEKHYADFSVDDRSPLYQYVGGESVPVRYNPADPDEFYYRDLLRSQVKTAVRRVLVVLLVVGFFSLYVWMRLN